MRQGWRIAIGWLVVVSLAVGTTGCESVKRKFIRKRKVERPVEPIFALEKTYRPDQPPEVRYQAHFAYWKAAHDDLLWGLGDTVTVKRRAYALTQAVKELRTMQELLEGPPAEGLGRLTTELEALRPRVTNALATGTQLSYLRSTLESLRRRIDKGYDYRHIKDHLKSDRPAPPETNP